MQTWVVGEVATGDDSASSIGLAEDLATLIEALRAVETRGRGFSGTGRGGELPDHDDWLGICFDRSEALLDVPRLRQLWSELRTLPKAGADVMSHTDLVPGNVLLREGRLVGVLDTGDFSAADPALDLVAAWHLLAAEPRAALRERLGCDEVEWARGMAWALQQAMGLVWYYRQSNPEMSRVGRQTSIGSSPQRDGSDADPAEQRAAGAAQRTTPAGAAQRTTPAGAAEALIARSVARQTLPTRSPVSVAKTCTFLGSAVT